MKRLAEKLITMATQNLLIMNLMRIITPEEIADIATKHNGGKFLSLTDLVNERVEKEIYRDFSSNDSVDIIHEEHAQKHLEKEAKILPFNFKEDQVVSNVAEEGTLFESRPRLIATSQLAEDYFEQQVEKPAIKEEIKIEHVEDENMSSFILIEKSRLKKSQKSLKQKEIIDLYQKNSNVDVEQIKSTNQKAGDSNESGVLVNKKQY
ncbi:MAG: hypothetical protein HOP07_09320 [Bacteriovoracaceae bacterium]|nr:hypothetical protein [Bacteriovoracaceae bacterium]